ncbi:unnamed protein product [Soboliphyme baturini]|uniref:Secreted protein n=1 Tax=Soboliphyme baturini TaxID=241478 RepID=A0A183J0C1_9BILA|nr:unnamed protein product [Soboliphyme baturini]
MGLNEKPDVVAGVAVVAPNAKVPAVGLPKSEPLAEVAAVLDAGLPKEPAAAG